MTMDRMSRRRALTGMVTAGGLAPVLAACGSEDGPDTQKGTDNASPGGAQHTSKKNGTLASTSDVPEGGGLIVTDQQVVITQPSAGDFFAFGSTCTHAGCQVSEVTDTILCACHGSEFSLANGSVVQGPATEPLPPVAIKVKGKAITLA